MNVPSKRNFEPKRYSADKKATTMYAHSHFLTDMNT